MILTEQQRQAVRGAKAPPTVTDPDTQTDYVLLRADEYQRLRSLVYDDSPWTNEEMDLLAAENADSLGWEGMDVYQDR